MERWTYFARRLLLVIPTFIGITLVSFALCQFVPGGPVEQILLQMRGSGGEGGRMSAAVGAISEEQRKALEKHFGFDQPVIKRYWTWLVTNRIGLAVESYKFPNKTVWQLIK